MRGQIVSILAFTSYMCPVTTLPVECVPSYKNFTKVGGERNLMNRMGPYIKYLCLQMFMQPSLILITTPNRWGLIAKMEVSQMQKG